MIITTWNLTSNATTLVNWLIKKTKTTKHLSP